MRLSFILLTALTVALAGCDGPKAPPLTRANILRVKVGMTEQEVRSALGWPTRTDHTPRLTSEELWLAEEQRKMLGLPKGKVDNSRGMTQTWKGPSRDAGQTPAVVVTVTYRDGEGQPYRVVSVKAEGIELYKVIGDVEVVLTRKGPAVWANVTNNSDTEIKDIEVRVYGYARNLRVASGTLRVPSWSAGASAAIDLGTIDGDVLVDVSVEGKGAPPSDDALAPRIERKWKSKKVE
jgi:hypothetical protein